MIKKFLNKVMAVMLGVTIISVSALNVNAAESNSDKPEETEQIQSLSLYDDIILPPDIKKHFTMDMPTGSGLGEIVISYYYYEDKNVKGYKAVLNAVMETDVTCDMGVEIVAIDSWGDRIILEKDAYQATSFYGRAQGVNLNSVYRLDSWYIWCCDDVDRGTITYGDTTSN